MDSQYQQGQVVSNPITSEGTDVNFNNSDDEPVPITLVLRLQPGNNSSNRNNGNGSNRCLYANYMPEVSSNFPNDNNICNSVLV